MKPIIIEGKYSQAKIFTNVIENEAREQIKRMLDTSLCANSTVRIMPDVHAGKGCTIGTTMTIVDRICPNLVGVDIGCGMFVANLGMEAIDLPTFDSCCHMVPSGMNVRKEPINKFDLTKLRCFNSLKDIDYLQCSLGTLGGGNHFIELEKSDNGTNYLVIHSGSRNLGKQVATYYQKLAIKQNSREDEYKNLRASLIREYKEQGKEKEIETALKNMQNTLEPLVSNELAYLKGKLLDDYLHDIKICQDYARLNRELIAVTILKTYNTVIKNNMRNLKILDSFHTIHNYIDVENKILRKGSISAQKDELLLIPLNMRDGSIFARGKGNPDWNYSAPHGAGRLMSRAAAKETLSLESFEKSMEGIYSTTVDITTIDEAPMAYKSIEDILEPVKDTIEIIEILKPIYNFKASEIKSIESKNKSAVNKISAEDICYKEVEPEKKGLLYKMFREYLMELSIYSNNCHNYTYEEFIQCMYEPDLITPCFIYAKNEIVGFVILENVMRPVVNKDSLYIVEFYISRKWRRKGIASQIFANILSETDLPIFFVVLRENLDAEKFWSKQMMIHHLDPEFLINRSDLRFAHEDELHVYCIKERSVAIEENSQQNTIKKYVGRITNQKRRTLPS